MIIATINGELVNRSSVYVSALVTFAVMCLYNHIKVYEGFQRLVLTKFFINKIINVVLFVT